MGTTIGAAVAGGVWGGGMRWCGSTAAGKVLHRGLFLWGLFLDSAPRPD